MARNTNAASIMIGEKAAEMIAGDHRVKLAEFVGQFRTLESRAGNRGDEPWHWKNADELTDGLVWFIAIRGFGSDQTE